MKRAKKTKAAKKPAKAKVSVSGVTVGASAVEYTTASAPIIPPPWTMIDAAITNLSKSEIGQTGCGVSAIAYLHRAKGMLMLEVEHEARRQAAKKRAEPEAHTWTINVEGLDAPTAKAETRTSP